MMDRRDFIKVSGAAAAGLALAGCAPRAASWSRRDEELFGPKKTGHFSLMQISSVEDTIGNSYLLRTAGGKVVVMAVNLANCKAPNFFNFAKRDLLVEMFRRLGGDGVVPVRVVDRANVMLIANDDGERLFLEAANLSCDSADGFVFEAMPPYVGGKVEILDEAVWRDADAIWSSNRLTVKPPVEIDVYGTLIMRIGKKE